MKRVFTCLVMCLMILSIFSGCDSGGVHADNAKIKVVSTIFPPYDWVREILGAEAENAEITLLMRSGVDLHSYQPTVDDMVNISNCDLFIHVGGESDAWVADALNNATNANMIVINLLDVLGDAVKEEEHKEGMQNEDEDEDEHNHDEPELDEHVWLSLRHAQTLCTYIAEQLSELDTEKSDTYKANATAYNVKLNSLDGEYAKAVKNGICKTLLFGDRFPFRYLVDDYELDYYAAFAGCSAETEASFETIVFLAEMSDDLSLHHIMVIEGSDQSIAKTIIQNTKEKSQKILVLDSLQSVTSSHISAGATYFGIMEDNLAVLKEALN